MIKFLKFDQVPLPVYKEVKGKDWIYYGEKNDYPDYLLRLYNNSAKHNAIITGKVDYICGNGWEVKSEDEMAKAKAYSVVDKVNTKGESLTDLTKKMATDLSIFGGYYLQVIWSKGTGEIAELYHLDYYKVRTNSINNSYFVADDWIKNGQVNPRPNYLEYPKFDENNRKGSQILYFKEYRAGCNIYSLPDYRGAISYIELDICIGEYHLNSINNGMFSSKLINLNGGRVSEEEENRIEKLFKDKFSGSKNAGKFMLAFNDSKENEPSIIDLSGTELDKHFDLLNKSVQQEIFSGHKVTSPMLFGIKTEGQLGGRAELREASELFQNTYINAKQKEIEQVINYLYSFNDITAEMLLNKTEPISFQFGEAIISANMTQDEIREKLSLPMIEKQESDSSQNLINSLNSLNPTLLQKVLENMNQDELRSLVGLTPQVQEEAVVTPVPTETMAISCSHTKNDHEILALFEGKGLPQENFIQLQQDRMFFSDMDEFTRNQDFAEYTLNAVQENIVAAIKGNPNATIEDIAKKAGVSKSVVTDRLNTLLDDGVIKEKISRDGTITRSVTKIGDSAIRKLTPITSYKILYSYEERPNVPKPLSQSRPLCQKLYGGKLYFTREEIQNISDQLGYSVFQLCGGWYTNPDTGVTTPYCRHEWKRNVVIEKTSR
jgi:DNA-binding MarR family transcriptional regulator